MTEQDRGSEDLGFELPAASRASPRRVVLVLVVLVGAVFAFGLLRAHRGPTTIVMPAQLGDGKAVRVEVVKPKTVQSDEAIDLPGVIKPLEETQIYPRATGYVRKWLVDIGDKVTAGQLLAEIEVPELDDQLAQARAQLAQAQATVKQAIAQRDFTKGNEVRYRALATQELVAKASVEQTAAQAANDEANLAAARSNATAQAANAHRLLESQAFSKVTAPFAGMITRRGIDRGTLVTDGKSTAMFDIVAIDPVRVFIDVPQSVAPSVRAGLEAKLSVREYGARVFTGKVTRSAGALDPDLHTMTTEIQVPNPDGALMPGMYVRVSLPLTVLHHVVEIPATALYSDASGLRVATIDKLHKVHFVPIAIERDTGAMLQISTGLTGDEKVIKIAVPTLAEGDPIEVTAPPPAPAGSGSGSAKPK